MRENAKRNNFSREKLFLIPSQNRNDLSIRSFNLINRRFDDLRVIFRKYKNSLGFSTIRNLFSI